MITVMICAFSLSFGLAHFIPNILDLVMPLNQTRPHRFLFFISNLFDAGEYFYLIVFILVIVTFLIQIALMSTTSIYAAYVQHVCGMFEIAW